MKLEQLKFKCNLCPHECNLYLGQQGKCLIRRGTFGDIGSSAIGFEVSTASLEPLNKKPITRFPHCSVRANDMTLSIGGYGCSMSCDYCQNWKVSQNKPEKVKTVLAKDIVDLATEKEVKIVCLTFNEPTLYFPYIIDLYKM